MQHPILLVVIVVTCLSVVGQSQFVPRPQQVHFGRMTYPRRWGRWCAQDMDCGRGFCQAYMCQCYRGYISWYYLEACSYEQRTKLAAFLVSFFVGPLGVDWFLLSRGNAGYIVTGIIKLLISLVCAIGWPLVFLNASKKKPKQVAIANIFNIIVTAASVIWWLTDWIRVLADVFYDGHGAPLQPWGYDYYDRVMYGLQDRL